MRKSRITGSESLRITATDTTPVDRRTAFIDNSQLPFAISSSSSEFNGMKRGREGLINRGMMEGGDCWDVECGPLYSKAKY